MQIKPTNYVKLSVLPVPKSKKQTSFLDPKQPCAKAVLTEGALPRGGVSRHRSDDEMVDLLSREADAQGSRAYVTQMHMNHPELDSETLAAGAVEELCQRVRHSAN